jgi:hypothetical protein
MAWRGASCLRDQNQRLDWFVRSVGSCVQYVAVYIGEGDDRARTDGRTGSDLEAWWLEPSPAQLCAGSWWCPTAWHRDPRKIPFGAPLPAGRSPPWRLDRAAPRRAGRRDRRRGLPILGHLRRVSCTYSRIAWSACLVRPIPISYHAINVECRDRVWLAAHLSHGLFGLVFACLVVENRPGA